MFSTTFTSEELVSCLQVCSGWRRVVGGLSGLWMRRCRDFGVPEHSLGGEHDDPVSIFLSARRQKNYLRACKHKVYEDIRSRGGCAKVSSDEDVAPRPHQVIYAGQGIVVAVMFRPREKDYQQVSQGRENAGLSGAGNFTPYNELKARYQFAYLLIERLNKTGVGSTECCQVELEEKWKWPVVTNAFAANNRSWVILRVKQMWIVTSWYKIILPTSSDSGSEQGVPIWKTPECSSEHHPTTPYSTSCCASCSAVVLVKNKLSMRPPWEFGVDLLHLSREQQVKEHTVPILNYDQMRLSSDPHANVVFQVFFFCKEAITSESDTCKSHKLVLWRTNDHVITVHSYSNRGGVFREPDAMFSPTP